MFKKNIQILSYKILKESYDELQNENAVAVDHFVMFLDRKMNVDTLFTKGKLDIDKVYEWKSYIMLIATSIINDTHYKNHPDIIDKVMTMKWNVYSLIRKVYV